MLLPERIYVIAGNYVQFERFKRYLTNQLLQNGFSTKNTDIVYVSASYILAGYRDIHGYFVGDWKQRRDMSEISSILIQRGCLENFIEVGI